MTEMKNAMTAATTDEVKDYMLDGTVPYRYTEDGKPVNHGGYFIYDGVASCRGCVACMRSKESGWYHCGLNGRHVAPWQPCDMRLSKERVAERLTERRRNSSSWVIGIDSKGRPCYDSFVDPDKVVTCKDCPARRSRGTLPPTSGIGECALSGDYVNCYLKCARGFDLEEVERRLAELEEAREG